jgi:hypothetical protein
MRKTAGFLFLVLLVVIGVGYWRGWFTVSANPQPQKDDKVVYNVEVDKQKFRKDTAAVCQAVKDRTSAAQAETLRGTVGFVDVTTRSFTLRVPGKEDMPFQVDSGTKIRRDESDLALKDLRAGEPVAVSHTNKDGVNVAMTVTVEKK